MVSVPLWQRRFPSVVRLFSTWIKPKLRKKLFSKPEKPAKQDVLRLKSIETEASGSSEDSFLSLFKKSIFCKPIHEGAVVKGIVVGSRYESLGPDLVRVVDFGLKNEVPVMVDEIQSDADAGKDVFIPLISLENEFSEPEVDYSGLVTFPKSIVDRSQLLLFPGSDIESKKALRLAFGRISKVASGSISVSVLGFEFNVPQAHFVSFQKPSVGSSIPLLIYNLSARTLFSKVADTQGLSLLPESLHLEMNGRASPYSAHVLLLSYLAHPEAFSKISGMQLDISSRERLIYLRQLSRIIEGSSTTPRSGRSQGTPTFF
eukprot:jgi/Galph1/967/GphlegSOOS_G5599.1